MADSSRALLIKQAMVAGPRMRLYQTDAEFHAFITMFSEMVVMMVDHAATVAEGRKEWERAAIALNRNAFYERKPEEQ